MRDSYDLGFDRPVVGFPRLRSGIPEAWNRLYRRLELFGGDGPRTLELARGVRMTRTIEKILVIETMAHIVPAAVAGVIEGAAVGAPAAGAETLVPAAASVPGTTLNSTLGALAGALRTAATLN
jgi:hypothetical protein